MRSISRLFGAVGTLADSLLALASVLDVATGKLRQQLVLDGVEVIEHNPAEIEEQPAKRGKSKSTAAA